MERVWKDYIKNEESKEYYTALIKKINKEYSSKEIYPPKDLIYSAFELTPYMDIKCVIIGQDPYFNKGEAHGLAFSVPGEVKIPPSLKNIYRELEEDLNISRRNGDLSGWAREGVFLLNRVLTVIKGSPNSHRDIGWLEFTKNCVKKLSERSAPMVFMLWGAQAGKLEGLIDKKHLILKAPHPSPLSSYRGFFGCKHFSKCNDFLKQIGAGEINWGRE